MSKAEHEIYKRIKLLGEGSFGKVNFIVILGLLGRMYK
jgi:hypothetical protein